MKQCDTCIYGNKSEYEKPCIVYKGENCEIYKKRSDGMENKEALSLIESYLKSGYAHNADDFKQALDMAIKALVQEPCGDLISREVVLKQINCWIGSGEYRYTNATDYLLERIRDISSANPQEPCEVSEYDKDHIWYKGSQYISLRRFLEAEQEPKTGHWIDKDEKSAVCSCCNRNNTLYGDFCKWCGAKMVEPQESEDKG